MSMRKYLRAQAKGTLERRGVSRINSRIAMNWRQIVNAYPGFHGKKRQKPGSSQPILRYPAPKRELKRFGKLTKARD